MSLVRSVDAHSFVSFRVARGWTQEELSRRSGYSIRLIRKAESGGNLRIETLKHLCQSFSQEGGDVRLEDITTSTLSVAKNFIDAYDRFGVNMIEHCRSHLHEDFSYTIHADRSTVPYGGTWNGVAGLQEMLNIFFSIFTRNAGWLQPEYMVGNHRVHARFLDQAYYQGELTPLIVINLHFEFRGLKIFKLDNEFDSDLTRHAITSRSTIEQSQADEQ